MKQVKAVLIGGEYDLTRMMVNDTGVVQMYERSTAEPINYASNRKGEFLPTEAVCKILHYRRVLKLRDGTVIFEYWPYDG